MTRIAECYRTARGEDYRAGRLLAALLSVLPLFLRGRIAMWLIRHPAGEHGCYMQAYGWLVPHGRVLHWFYHFTERHNWAYSATIPLWIGRYRFLSRKAQSS